jgi:peptide/nickel transport system permease protein
MANDTAISAQSPHEPELWYLFKRSPVAILSTLIITVIVACVLLAPLIAPYDVYALGSTQLMDANTPPMSSSMFGNYFVLGSDNQGRDVLSVILYGSRTSLFVAAMATALALIVGLTLGISAGYFGGLYDQAVMRLVDIQLSFPAIMIALMVFGVTRGFIAAEHQEAAAKWVLIISISLSNWAQFARTARSSTMVQRSKDYVDAARMMGTGRVSILFGHILPNVLSPILVVATIGFAVAVIEESTLSYLGVGVPPTQPSLGTLIRVGQQFLFSGEWWILLFPAMVLVLFTLSVNLLGDWLRVTLNPKLR